jgi:hypothetical protein
MEMEFSSKLTYIPKWNGNREAPEIDKITAVYRNPSLALKSRLLPKPELRFQYDPDGKVRGGETVVGSDRKAIVDGMLIRLEGLAYRMDEEKKVVHTPKDLWEAPSYYDGLIDDLADFFKEELEKKIDEKN